MEVCTQLGKLGPHGSPCALDEWTLCLFVTHFTQSVRPATIKVYLSAVRALHIEQSFSDPLVDCPRLQRVARGIKRSAGEARSTRLPVTDQTLLLVFKALDFSKHDHILFWAACNLAYFGFLRSSEFTVPNLGSFSPDSHLSVADIAIDSYDAPLSKTDPFRKGCLIHVGKSNPPLCAIHSLMAYLQLRGNGAGPLFLLQDGRPLSRALLTDLPRRTLTAVGVHGSFSSLSFRIGAATVATRNGIPDH